jgi:membrane peptidoglycan carboxypeptidase
MPDDARRDFESNRSSGTAAAASALAAAVAADARRLAQHAWPRLRSLAATSHGGGRRIGKLARTLLIMFGVGALFVVLGFIGALVWTLHGLRVPSLEEVTSQQIIQLETAEGQPLVRKGASKLPAVELRAFPRHLLEAVISIEDRRFYEHGGVDPWAVLRALRENLAAGEIVAGGSTITQQLVKIRLLSPERTLKRKAHEAALAIWLERRLTKDEILATYLNSVYLGAGAIGMPAAAQTYFGKTVGDLSLAEAAMLAGMISAPTQLNPIHDLAAARERAAVVLDAMVDNGKLDQRAAASAKERPAQVDSPRIASAAGTWFADWVAKQAEAMAGASGGTVRVRTTFVPRLQALAEDALNSVLKKEGERKRATRRAARQQSEPPVGDVRGQPHRSHRRLRLDPRRRRSGRAMGDRRIRRE